MITTGFRAVFLILLVCSVSIAAMGQEPETPSNENALVQQLPTTVRFDERFDIWPIDLKINGRIIVDNEARSADSLDWLTSRLAQNEKLVCFLAESIEEARFVEQIAIDAKQPYAIERVSFDILPVKQLKAALVEANVVALYLADNAENSAAAWNELRTELADFIKRGNTLIVNAAAGEALAAFDSKASPGLGMLPDCVLDCSGAAEQEVNNRVLSVLAIQRRSVGISLSKGAILVLSGRKMTCHGEGRATFQLMANESEPLRVETIVAGERNGLIDLTEWRRDAIDRTLEPFPDANPAVPYVPNGTLVIVGGGGMPDGLMQRIVDLAGGNDAARMVYVPCSEEDVLSPTQRTVESWKKMGVKHATFIHTKDRNRANGDEEFLSPLKEATGLWFGGGRQWNFADSYYGTEAHRLMKQVLDRGGVIGGSSAGASIQARYLARATPIGNFRIMAPGYERGGLGFLTGVAIDQHFSQRRRQQDMTQLVDRYPQLLGIGIDEATAIIVQKSLAEVVGRGKVHFYDRNLPVYPDQADFIALPAGSTYDLAKREVVHDTSE